MRELETAAGDYRTPLRMGDSVSPEAERRLHGALERLREDLGDDTIVKRALATLLAELVVAANAGIDHYAGKQREEVAESVATIGEAVMAVLTPSDMPPVRRRT